MSTRHQPNPLDQEHIMQTYQITDTDGQHVATVTASSHRRAALAISCHRDETDIHPVIQGDGRSGCIDDAYGVHLMVEGRELVVTDVELATDTRPEAIHAHPLMPAEPVRAHLDPLAGAHHLADVVSHEITQLPDDSETRAALVEALDIYRESCR